MTTTDNPTATFVRDLPAPAGIPGATRKLWRMEPPLKDYEGEGHPLVMSSAVDHSLGGMIRIHETYLFPADESGEITDWGGLPGSYQGDTNHEAAIRGAGYEPVPA